MEQVHDLIEAINEKVNGLRLGFSILI